MRERPILFSGPMVLALLAGRKTQTRRQYKPRRQEPWEVLEEADDGMLWPHYQDEAGDFYRRPCPYGQPGDRLWVRETWGYRGTRWESWTPDEIAAFIQYQADGAKLEFTRPHAVGDLRPAGMPAFRCGKSCDGDGGGAHGDELTRYWRSWRPSIHMPRWASRITLEVTSVCVERLQAISEDDAQAEGVEMFSGRSNRDAFSALWNSINGNWAANPWVWVVSFKRLPKEGT